MQNLETLTIDDIMRIFHLSRNTVYRRLREARAGRGGLPLPIPTGAKRSLRWNAEDVKKFLESANDQPQTSPTLRGYLVIKHWKIKGSAFPISGKYVKKPGIFRKVPFSKNKIP